MGRTFANSTPEPVPVTLHNNAFQVSLGEGAEWFDHVFTRAQAAANDGVKYPFAFGGRSFECADENEVFLTIDNVVLEREYFSIGGGGTYITLSTALADGSKIRIRALVREG